MEREQIKICPRVFTSSTKLLNRKFHVIERTRRTAAKYSNIKKRTCKENKTAVPLMLNMKTCDVFVAVVDA